MSQSRPYAVPKDLPSKLVEVGAYWRGLLRGSASVPFADDLDMATLAASAGDVALIEVFEKPERFRFASVGAGLASGQAGALDGRFLDEVNLKYPFEFLRSQCSATIESAAPTCHRQQACPDQDHAGYSRLMLPFWAEGHISLVLVALVRG